MPLPGVSVLIKQNPEHKQILTENFLSKQANDVLVFSYIGMKNEEYCKINYFKSCYAKQYNRWRTFIVTTRGIKK
jgi:hypothetical protein